MYGSSGSLERVHANIGRGHSWADLKADLKGLTAEALEEVACHHGSFCVRGALRQPVRRLFVCQILARSTG